MRPRLLLLLLGLSVLPHLALAQAPGGPHPEGPRGEGPWRERARMFLVLRIADALKLNDADALKVSNVIRQSDEHRQELVKQRQGLEDKLREALAKQPEDTAEITKLISQGNEIDQKLALVPEDSFHELQKILTVDQQARLMLFRRQLQGEIRGALAGRHSGGGRRGWQARGGPPPADE
jgi:Spy/CpxP family protein refolding chaperone